MINNAKADRGRVAEADRGKAAEKQAEAKQQRGRQRQNNIDAE